MSTLRFVAEASERPNTAADDELRQLARNMPAVFDELHQLSADGGGNDLADRLHSHLGADPRDLPVVSQELPSYQLVDVQVALEVWATEREGRSVEVLGIAGEQRRFHPLSELVAGAAHGVRIGPVDYVDLADGPDSTRSCVRFGMFLLSDGDQRAAVLLRGADPHGPMQAAMIELLSSDRAYSHEVLAELRQMAVQYSVLRGNVLALGPGEGNEYGGLRFVHRPELTRDQLILPDVTLGQIERHVVGIALHSTRLQEVGQHLKRGVLLYGPPGTGKTHTIRYLLSQRQGVTAFILSGQALALIGQACGLARLLQPSIVILEDVDLIAGDRSFGPVGGNPLLFEVLNQIDGLGDDVDVTFILTTNRVDILERALSERPGRVDAAVEIASPDAEGRARLFRLYGALLGIAALGDTELAAAVASTEGRTATYLREVVRRAALRAAETQPSGTLRVDGEMLSMAAAELLEDRATLTRSLLGGPDEPDSEPPLTSPMGFPQMGMRMLRASGFRGRPGMTGPPIPFGPDS
jgi:cell division protease FtsH